MHRCHTATDKPETGKPFGTASKPHVTFCFKLYISIPQMDWKMNILAIFGESGSIRKNVAKCSGKLSKNIDKACALYATNLSTNSAQYLVGGAIKAHVRSWCQKSGWLQSWLADGNHTVYYSKTSQYFIRFSLNILFLHHSQKLRRNTSGARGVSRYSQKFRYFPASPARSTTSTVKNAAIHNEEHSAVGEFFRTRSQRFARCRIKGIFET